MSLVVATFQIPLTEDRTLGKGTRHPPFRWKRLEDALYERFEGWTRDPGETTGVWKDRISGKPVRDRCRVFHVDLAADRVGELRTLLCRACLTFVQQEIRTVIDGKPEYLKAGRRHEPL